MTTSYPKPDRSTFKPNSQKTPENDALDIGWAEGVLSDNRPFRMEYWCQDQCSIATFFFSTVELDFPTPANVRDFLEREGLVRFRTSEGEATGGRCADCEIRSTLDTNSGIDWTPIPELTGQSFRF